MKEFLEQLMTSLGKIEVKGRDNLDILLGCIMAVERAIDQLDAPAETEEEDNGR